jgi:protocatechuate 3,4-dioxygenase, alpha subunit
MTTPSSASQTIGPFFSIGLSHLQHPNLTRSGATGGQLTVHGRVLDADRNPVPDAQLEIWHADAHGKYPRHENAQPNPAEPDFHGFARVFTDDLGAFRFTTIKPGPVPAPHRGLQAPHIVVLVFMRGLLHHLITRVYFPGEPANAADPILNLVRLDRRHTLIAKLSAENAKRFEWNILLQGDAETVFFDY